jgi:hypothetical protein
MIKDLVIYGPSNFLTSTSKNVYTPCTVVVDKDKIRCIPTRLPQFNGKDAIVEVSNLIEGAQSKEEALTQLDNILENSDHYIINRNDYSTVNLKGMLGNKTVTFKNASSDYKMFTVKKKKGAEILALFE